MAGRQLHTPAPLRNLLIVYLNARGSSTMEDLVSRSSPYRTLTTDQDVIDYDNMI